MKSMYPTQIGFVGTFQGKFAKYCGPPSCKNATTQFHKQNPEKAYKTLWNPCTQFRLDVWGLFKGNLLSTLGLRPAKMQQSNFIRKIKKKLQKPYETHVISMVVSGNPQKPSWNTCFGIRNGHVVMMSWLGSGWASKSQKPYKPCVKQLMIKQALQKPYGNTHGLP